MCKLLKEEHDMELNAQTVKRIAELSRLELSAEEVEQYQDKLQKILQAFSNLANIPLPKELEGDARCAIVLKQAENSNEDISRLSQDVANNSLPQSAFLAESPEREGAFIRVPAILNSTT